MGWLPGGRADAAIAGGLGTFASHFVASGININCESKSNWNLQSFAGCTNPARFQQRHCNRRVSCTSARAPPTPGKKEAI